MGSLQLEPAIRPSSPFHASGFDEERYLAAGGARAFYMNDANVLEKRIDKEKLSFGSYGDERKERGSSGYGDDDHIEKRLGGATSLIGLQAQHEKKAINGDDCGRKNKICIGYGEEKKKKKEEQLGERRERRGERVEKREKKEGREKVDYVHRGQWLRAAILGANDGLVSTASLMMGVGAVKDDDDGKAMVISGLAGLVGGACSMAIGEFVSVYSQRDAETFHDKLQKELLLKKGPPPPPPPPLGDTQIKDLEEGTMSPFGKFLSREDHFKGGSHIQNGSHDFPPSNNESALSRASHDFTPSNNKSALRGGSHANKQEGGFREESKKQLGKQKKEEAISIGPSPWEAAVASGLAFALGAMVPLLSASFIKNPTLRLVIMMVVSSGALVCMGTIAAKLSAGSVIKGGVRVLLGGWAAMLVTYGVLRLFGTSGM